MSKCIAVRDIKKCTKDCLCLYVCPTGASDTENSIIDVNKCIGCGSCAKACPSRAISMIPTQLPKEQIHDEKVIKAMKVLFKNKAEVSLIAKNNNDILSKAISKSCHIMAEDLIRESGYMLPNGEGATLFYKSLLNLDNLSEESKEIINGLI